MYYSDACSTVQQQNSARGIGLVGALMVVMCQAASVWRVSASAAVLRCVASCVIRVKGYS